MMRLLCAIAESRRLRQGVSLLFFLFIAPLIKINAEPQAQARFNSGLYIPQETSLYNMGYGAAGALDFLLFPALGLTLQGEYISVPIKSGGAVTLLDGSVGPSLIWQPLSRFNLVTDLTAGVYSASSLDRNISGVSAGARLSATWRLSPSLNLTAYGGVKHFSYTPEALMNTVSAGISISLNLSELMSSETRIAVEKINQNMVFPVSYSWYNENSFAVVRITNRERNEITMIDTSFYLEQYMSQPKFCGTHAVLQPGESVDVPLTAFFNEAILQLTENITANAKVIVEYRSLGSLKKAEVALEMPIYHRNAMSWDDDRRASSFVSARDPAVQWFSRYVSLLVRDRFRPGINRNIQYALGLFEALNIYGINYIIDPASSYVALSASSSSLDSLNYPYQTLLYRGGDCDDLSILFSSLLEAAGIDTAFLTIPSHIYMAFDSGMSEEEAKRDFYASADLIYHEGRAWVPLEITIPKEGFYRAWRIGAKEWRDASGRGMADIFPMKKSWALYPPVSVPGASSRFNLPDQTRLALAFDSSLDTYIEYEIRPQVLSRETRLAQGENPGLRNELGVLYGRYGMLGKAREQFARAAEMESIHGRINLGNLAFLEQRYQEALGHYQGALTRQPDNQLALLGMARCYYELNDFAVSDSYYAEVRRSDPGLARQYAYLASFFENRGRAYSLSDRLVTTTWSLPAQQPAAPAAESPAPETAARPPEPPPAAPQAEIATAPEESGVPREDLPPVEPAIIPPAAFAGGAEDRKEDAGGPDPGEEPDIADEPDIAEAGGLSGMLSIDGARLSSIREDVFAPPVTDPGASAPAIPLAVAETPPVAEAPAAIAQAPSASATPPVVSGVEPGPVTPPVAEAPAAIAQAPSAPATPSAASAIPPSASAAETPVTPETPPAASVAQAPSAPAIPLAVAETPSASATPPAASAIPPSASAAETPVTSETPPAVAFAQAPSAPATPPVVSGAQPGLVTPPVASAIPPSASSAQTSPAPVTPPVPGASAAGASVAPETPSAASAVQTPSASVTPPVPGASAAGASVAPEIPSTASAVQAPSAPVTPPVVSGVQPAPATPPVSGASAAGASVAPAAPPSASAAETPVASETSPAASAVQTPPVAEAPAAIAQAPSASVAPPVVSGVQPGPATPPVAEAPAAIAQAPSAAETPVTSETPPAVAIAQVPSAPATPVPAASAAQAPSAPATPPAASADQAPDSPLIAETPLADFTKSNYIIGDSSEGFPLWGVFAALAGGIAAAAGGLVAFLRGKRKKK
jgi:tetratricopeptide (TPR) repeat protein